MFYRYDAVEFEIKSNEMNFGTILRIKKVVMYDNNNINTKNYIYQVARKLFSEFCNSFYFLPLLTQ